MAIAWTLKRSFIAVGVALSACGGRPSTENPEYRGGRGAGRRRARGAAEGTTPARRSCRGSTAGRHRLAGGDREARPGHRRLSERRRSRPRREVRVPQRPESAAGLGLVPRQPGRLQRRAVRALQDDPRSRSQSRRIRRCAPSPGSGSARRPCPPAAGAGGRLDARSHRHRPQSGRLRRRRGASGRASASRRCRSASPSRTRDRSSRCRRPRRRSTTARLLARRVFQNTSLLLAKLRTADKEENWETRSPGLRQPGRDGSRVLLVRRLPRRPRDGRRGR